MTNCGRKFDPKFSRHEQKISSPRSESNQKSTKIGLTPFVIRRLTDRHRAYTGIFLPGEPPRIFPTSDAEHRRILQIYKQDRPHDGIINDFSEFAIGRDDTGSTDRASDHILN
jgi:hypothetical protein